MDLSHRSHGASMVQTSRFESGKKMMEAELCDGLLCGQIRFWYESGQLAAEGAWYGGRPHGVTRYFYEDGSLWRQVEFKDGHPTGPVQVWDRSGVMREFDSDLAYKMESKLFQSAVKARFIDE